MASKEKWIAPLSTTEPHNHIGLIQVRQHNKNSETWLVPITQNGEPFDMTQDGIKEVFFCTKFQNKNTVEQRATIIDAKKGHIKYTMNQYDMQKTGIQHAYFKFVDKDGNYQGSTQSFSYKVIQSIEGSCTESGTYIVRLEELFELYQDFYNQQKQDATDYHVDQTEMWEKFVEFNREILESIDPGGKIMTMLFDLIQIVDKKEYFEKTVKSMLDYDYKLGDVINTKGYHYIFDGGAAKYIVVKNENFDIDKGYYHLLKNGLVAKMLIEKESIDVRQFGAKSDWDASKNKGTDNFEPFKNALKYARTVKLGKDTNYYISEQIVINHDLILDGSFSSLFFENDGILQLAQLENTPQTRNINIIQSGERNGVGFKSLNPFEQKDYWGSNSIRQNITVKGFKIGFYDYSTFSNLDMKFFVKNCDIGRVISGSFANSNVSQTNMIVDCDIGTYLDNAKNFYSLNDTFENVKYALVINSDSCENITFEKPWFEKISKEAVVFGKLDLENLNIERVKPLQTLHIIHHRYNKDNIEESIFSKENFLEEDNFKALNFYKNGKRFKNLSTGFVVFNEGTSGTTKIETKETPFSPRDKCFVGYGLSGGFKMTLSTDENMKSHLFGEDVFLIKFAIRTDKPISLFADVADENGNVDTNFRSSAIILKGGAWETVSFIVKTKDLEKKRKIFPISFYDRIPNEKYEINIGRILIVNLSNVYGKGNEPSLNKTSVISQSFDFCDYLQYSYAGIKEVQIPIKNPYEEASDGTVLIAPRSGKLVYSIGGKWFYFDGTEIK